MEWVEGENLANVFDRPSEKATRRTWYSSTGSGRVPRRFPKVHAAGLAHLDVSPNNIRVTPEGQIKLMDFGIARSETERQDLMTRTRLGVGTPAYMAPEQFDDQGNRQSDVYSLCATFFELFTRRRLFDHDRIEPAEVNRRQARRSVSRPASAIAPEIPWEVETLLKGGLRSEAADRPTSQQLADDLRRVQEDRPIRYRRRRCIAGRGSWYRRHSQAVLVAAPVVALLAMLAAVLGVFWHRAEEGRIEAGGRVVSLSKKVDAETGRANANERLKFLQQYVADMRLVPELWKNARVELIRDRFGLTRPRPERPQGVRVVLLGPARQRGEPDLEARALVSSIDWSPDGKVAYATDTTGRLSAWDRSTGPRREIRGPQSGSVVVAAAATGHRLAVVNSSFERNVAERLHHRRLRRRDRPPGQPHHTARRRFARWQSARTGRAWRPPTSARGCRSGIRQQRGSGST